MGNSLIVTKTVGVRKLGNSLRRILGNSLAVSVIAFLAGRIS